MRSGRSHGATKPNRLIYVPYLHFVERLYLDASTPVAHGAEEGTRDAGMKPGTASEHRH
ncbi:MAG: hypothetical protein M1377_07275 [Deltaproteobacteria bacterium]|nr:hypothetical protein [Deltaproteobacteria bacterium]